MRPSFLPLSCSVLALLATGTACFDDTPDAGPDAGAIDESYVSELEGELQLSSNDDLDFRTAYSVGDIDCVYEHQTEQPKGRLENRFRVLTANIYGQYVEDSLEPLGFRPDSVCEDRLRAIGRQILDADPPYEIVGLQEWHPDTIATCDGQELASVIGTRYPSQSSGFFPAPSGFRWRNFRWGHPKANEQIDGGVGIIARAPFLWEDYDEDDFDPGFLDNIHLDDDYPVVTHNVHQFRPRLKPRGAHGVAFARIYLRYPDLAVDTYVVHVPSTQGDDDDSCDEHCKSYMLGQLREVIHERSASSGFPVLVMGDFNIGGPNPSYQECVGNSGYASIMDSLGSPVDVWLQAHPGQGGATHNWDHLSKDPSRIDFMFIPNDPYLVNSELEIRIGESDDVRIVDWGGLSDHHGIEAFLELRHKLEAERLFAAVL